MAMVIRAELQVNAAHAVFKDNDAATSFLQKTVPNEKVIELAKERTLRLAREKTQPDGKLRKDVRGKPVKKGDQKLNPESKRVGLTGTEKKSLFQTAASREGRESGAVQINTWGARENDNNMNYGLSSSIKWASDTPKDSLNIVSGRRLINECVQCGLFALYEKNEEETCKFFNLY